MKAELISLIDDVPSIKALFHTTGNNGMLYENVIRDVPDFQTWKQRVCIELREIADRTGEQYISDTIELFQKPMKGINDKGQFSEMEGRLKAIKENIDSYYGKEKAGKGIEFNKPSKIFISHSTVDKAAVEKLVELLRMAGLSEDSIFCSSLPGYDIPVDSDIFDYIREQFLRYDLHVVFIHSKNYYSSPVSLNEMGAAWCLKTRATSFLLPGFDFGDMKGVVNSGKTAIKLDNDIYEVKDKLNQLRNMLSEEFGIVKGSDAIWEKARDGFIEAIKVAAAC